MKTIERTAFCRKRKYFFPGFISSFAINASMNPMNDPMYEANAARE